MKPVNSHDKYFKATFSKKEEAMDLIRHVFPTGIVERLDFDSLKLDNNSYISKELKESFSDLVYDCNYKNETVIKIALLFEHKSEVPDYPHLQLLRYFMEIWQSNIKQKQPLVPVVPLVVYHGRKKWEYKSFENYFTIVDDELEKYLPVFDYLLADLSNYADDQIGELFEKVSVQIGLRILKNNYRQQKIAANLHTIFNKINILLQTEEGENFLTTTLHYLFESTEIESTRLIEQLKIISEKGGEIAMTTATKLRREGMRE